MGLYTYNGQLLIRGNALAGSQDCCCLCEYYRPGEPDLYGSEFLSYSYFDTVPPAPDFCDCPCYKGCDNQPPSFGLADPACFDPNNPCVAASCCGEELECYVRSSNFVITGTCQPRATVLQGALFDDHGTIEGQDRTLTLNDPCVVNPLVGGQTFPLPTHPLPSNETLVPFVVDNGDGTVYLKLNLVVKNGQVCGPYGVIGMTVEWYFE